MSEEKAVAVKEVLELKRADEEEKRSASGVSCGRNADGFTLSFLKSSGPLRLEPTYRLDSKYPVNKELCETFIRTIMNQTFDEFGYQPRRALNICAEVSEEIKDRVRDQLFDRYRFICMVNFGEKAMQGYCHMINFLWDSEKDGYTYYNIDRPGYFVTCAFFWLYMD